MEINFDLVKKEIVKKLSKIKPEKIYLFGSFAWDILHLIVIWIYVLWKNLTNQNGKKRKKLMICSRISDYQKIFWCQPRKSLILFMM